jgi:Ca2+-binding RTX toxin-like protein
MGGTFTGMESSRLALELALGDFNHDGLGDYVVADHNGNDGRGQVIVIFGRVSGEEEIFDLNDLEDDEYIILQNNIPASEQFNVFTQFSRAIVTGDFNGDGIDDIGVGAQRTETDAGTTVGGVALFYGRGEEETDQLLEGLVDNVLDAQTFDGTDGFIINGVMESDAIGSNLLNLGDLDGDGADELGIAGLYSGTSPNQFNVIWGDGAAMDPTETLGTLPPERVTSIINLPGTVDHVETLPFEALDPLAFQNRQEDPGGFINAGRGGDLLITFGTSTPLQPPMFLEGNLIQPGEVIDFDDLASDEFFFAPIGQEDGTLFPSAATVDHDFDGVPELWLPTYKQEGGTLGFDWNLLPPGPSPDLDIDPAALPPGVRSIDPPELDGQAPFGGRDVRSGDLFGDVPDLIRDLYELAYDLFEDGFEEEGFFILATIELLMISPPHLYAMLSAIISIATDSNQLLGDNFFGDAFVVDDELTAAVNVDDGSPDPIFGGGAIDIFRNFEMSENPTLEADQLDGMNGYRIYGQEAYGGTGWESAVGDVTGDGVEDLVFSVPFASTNGVSNSGAIHTLVGGEKNLRAQDAQDGTLDGIIFSTSLNQTPELRAGLAIFSDELSGLFGENISSAGDLNNDGLDDFIVTQRLGDRLPDANVGEVYVFFGQHNFGQESLTLPLLGPEQGFVIYGDEGQQIGSSVAGIGDVNNDGIDDIAVGADWVSPEGRGMAGSVFVLYGRESGDPFPTEINIHSLSPTEGARFDGGAEGVLAGGTVVGLGDISGDGIPDFAIGAPGASPNDRDGAGQVHVVFGNNGNFAGPTNLDALDGTNGFTIQGASGADGLKTIAPLGDVNGDGLVDLILGDSNFNNENFAHVVLGTDLGFPAVIDLAENTVGISGEPGGILGVGLNGGGDFNGDGRADLPLSDPFSNELGPAAGTVGLYFGSPTLLNGGNTFPPDVLFTSGIDESFFSADVTFAGDVNGDGYDDLLMSIADNSDIAHPGEVYLVFGRPDMGLGQTFDLRSLDGHAGYRIVGAVEGEGFGVSLGRLGDIDGDGFDDFAMGLPQDSSEKPIGTPCISIFFGGAANLVALDLADGVQDGQIDFHNTGIAYTESALSLPGNGIWEGGFLNDVAGLAAFDGDGDQISLGDDTIEGREGDDWLLGSLGNDLMDGGAGNDTLRGEDDDDTLSGAEGDDHLLGDEGEDELSGGDGQDTLEGGDDNDVLRGDGGSDSLLGGEGEDHLQGGDANDELDGGSGDDTLEGGDGNDLLKGDAGEDRLVGGPGEDTLTGGTDSDTFVIDFDSGNTTVTDFEPGLDLLDLSAFFRLDALGAYFDRVAGSTILTLPENRTITLENIEPEELTPESLMLEGENIPVSGSLVFFGLLEEGALQTIGLDGLSDPEGIDRSTEQIQWLRDGVPIGGAVAEEYLLTDEDIGHEISVRYSYTDFFGASETVTSTPKGPVVESNAPFVGRPTIVGETIFEDETLAVDMSGVTDADGIDPASFLFQWQRAEVDVSGATSSTYRLTQADVGSEMRVLVTLSDVKGNSATIASLVTVAVGNVDDPLLGNMILTGTPEVGETLSSDASALSDEDGINDALTTYYWTRNGITIPGETNNTYIVTEEDLGTRIYAGARITDLFGNVTNRSGANVFINTPPSGQVSITGQAEEGGNLTADISGIVEPDVIQAETLAYQWRRDGEDISGAGASGPTYAVTAADVGAEITVRVSYVDEGGTEEAFTSGSVFPIVQGQLVEGTPGPDSLPGGAGRDTILGFGADDHLIGGAADDLLDGGAGSDTGVFAGSQTSYSLTLSPTQALLTDRRAPEAGGQGTDTLLSIEFLDFDTEIDLFGGNPMNLSIFDGPTTLTAPQFSEIIELYIAYFNRAPDALGLFYWATEFANGFSIPDMAANFFGQPETQATYASVLDASGGLDITDVAKVGAFVTAVYNNVLGRGPDGPGFDYWVDQLQNVPAITPDVFILAIIGGAKFPSNPTEQTAIDQAYLATKSDLGASFAVIKGMSDIADATATMALFDGTDVGRDATLAAIEGHHADALDPITGDFLMPLVGVIDDPFA